MIGILIAILLAALVYWVCVMLGLATHRDLDRRLDRVGHPLARVRVDPALGGRADELRVLLLHHRDDRTARVLGDLLDQAERIVVVLVDDDDREIRVVARDDLGSLLHSHGELGDLVAQIADERRRDTQRTFILVGEQHLHATQVAVVIAVLGHASKALSGSLPCARRTLGCDIPAYPPAG